MHVSLEKYHLMKKILLLTAVLMGLLSVGSNCESKEPKIPHHAGLALQKAYLLIDQKEIEQAIDVLKAFRAKGRKELQPDQPDTKGYTHYLVDFTLANCFLMTDRPSAAYPLYASTVEKKPSFSPAWINLARCCYDLNRFQKAATSFVTGYETSEEKKPDILYYGAVAFMAAEAHQKAIDVFERLLSVHLETVKLEWQESLVQAYLSADLPLKALPFIEELAEKSDGEKRKQWQEVLFYQYVNLNMKRKALGYAKQLTREYPVDPKWWKALAHLHFSENRHDKGMVALTVYGLLTPLTGEEKKLMAELNATLGIPIQAARFYEDILAQKIDLEIIKRLAETYAGMNRFEDALKWIEKGLASERQADLLMMKGRLLYEIKAYPEAMTVFAAIPDGKHSGRAYLMLGYAALNAGDLGKAKSALEKASRFADQKKTAIEALKQL
jgi:tetratricopeptide (TPR) repeat protein